MRNISRIIVIALLILSISSLMIAKEKITPKGRVNLRNGNMYLQQRNLDKAQIFFEEVLKDNPGNIEATKKLADINFANAEDKADKAFELYSKAYDQYKEVSTALSSVDTPEKDQEDWKKDSDKKMLGCWARIFNVGKMEVQDGNYDHAVIVFNKLYEMNPEKIESLKMLLYIYQSQQNNAKIEEMLNKLLAVNPKDQETLNNLGAFYYKNQRQEDALRVFQQIAEISPNDVNNLFLIAQVYNDMKHYKEALATTEKILVIEPKNIDALNNAKDFSAALNDDANEIKYYKLIIEQDKTAENLNTFCFTLAQKQMYSDLLTYGQQWFELDANSKEAVQLIILAAQKTKNKPLETKYSNILKLMK